MEWKRGEYRLTDDGARADLDAICSLLMDTYWASGRPREKIASTIGNSLCFSLFHRATQTATACTASTPACY